MNAIKRQRFMLVGLLLAGVVTAVVLVLFALSENINHYYSPAQMHSGDAPVGNRIRGGGIVVPGSVARDSGGLTVVFDISDGEASVEMEYTGLLPDLFREGQGVVGTGHLGEDGRFIAEELLARHDENYTPLEVQRALDEAEARTQESTS